jgi:hypothetical protein
MGVAAMGALAIRAERRGAVSRSDLTVAVASQVIARFMPAYTLTNALLARPLDAKTGSRETVRRATR